MLFITHAKPWITSLGLYCILEFVMRFNYLQFLIYVYIFYTSANALDYSWKTIDHHSGFILQKSTPLTL